jgi:hypothetical protein
LDGAVEQSWQRFEEVSLGLAATCTFYFTIVSMDFATSVIPGWHTTFSLRIFCWVRFRFCGKTLAYHEKSI